MFFLIIQIDNMGFIDMDFVVSVKEVILDTRERINGITDISRVLVIYTGGTIGSAPKDWNDPESPEIVYPWEKLRDSVKALGEMPFYVDAISFENPLDSANVGPKEWRTMAEIIKNNYNKYVGFVIAHGTDTMVYTASALSFILQNLTKPVVITGSQIPALLKVRNDAQQNLITSLLIANYKYSKIECVPEVCIFFRDKLIRGNRSKKINASGFNAFDSLNYPTLGMAGDDIDINYEYVKNKKTSEEFHLQPVLSTDVMTLDIFPGLQYNPDLYKAMLGWEKMRGLVLKTYGAGNIPTDKNFVDELQRTIKRDVIVVNVTQCPKGDVQQGLYETSSVLQDIGVISGQDMTHEAALCKLMNILGDEDIPDVPSKKERFEISLAGEQECSMYTTEISSEPLKISCLENGTSKYRTNSLKIKGFPEDKSRIKRCLLRFVGARIDELIGVKLDSDEKLLLKIFVNSSRQAEADIASSTFAGMYVKSKMNVPQTYTFDLVHTARTQLKSESTFNVYVEPHNGIKGSISWERLELTLFVT